MTVCEKDDVDAVMVIVPAVSMVNAGTVIVDALGIAVSVQLVSAHERSPGPGSPGIVRDAEQVIVLVPLAVCVTVVVPEAIVHVEFFAIEYCSDDVLS